MMIGVVELPSGSAPHFGLLHDVIIHGQEPSILFVFISMETLGYDASLGAYATYRVSLYIPLIHFMLPSF